MRGDFGVGRRGEGHIRVVGNSFSTHLFSGEDGPHTPRNLFRDLVGECDGRFRYGRRGWESRRRELVLGLSGRFRKEGIEGAKKSSLVGDGGESLRGEGDERGDGVNDGLEIGAGVSGRAGGGGNEPFAGLLYSGPGHRVGSLVMDPRSGMLQNPDEMKDGRYEGTPGKGEATLRSVTPHARSSSYCLVLR